MFSTSISHSPCRNPGSAPVLGEGLEPTTWQMACHALNQLSYRVTRQLSG